MTTTNVDTDLVFPSTGLKFDNDVFLTYKTYIMKLGAKAGSLFEVAESKRLYFVDLHKQFLQLLDAETVDYKCLSTTLDTMYKYRANLITFRDEVKEYKNLGIDVLRVHEKFVSKYWPDKIPPEFKSRTDELCQLIQYCLNKCDYARSKIRMMLIDINKSAPRAEAKLAELKR